MIHRRTFLRGLTLGGLAVPLAAAAQQAGKVTRVGILSSANPRSDAIFQAFEQRLRELGHVEGQNVGIEFRNADGRFERLTGLAIELVDLNVNVIVTASPVASRAVKSATDTIPIVMLAVNYDPMALGYVRSLARPGTNVTGLFFLHRELTAKRFGLFKEMLPNVHQIAVVTDTQTADQFAEVEAANLSVGAKLQTIELRNGPQGVDGLFRAAKRSGAGAVFMLESSSIFRGRREIAQAALQNRLPTSLAFREYLEAGGLISYGVKFLDMWRRAADYTDKILKGAKPADLPIEQPTKCELVINLKTAKALGLTIPQSLLLRVDQVIE
jgi:putative ABC transport system substrate-binding protein